MNGHWKRLVDAREVLVSSEALEALSHSRLGSSDSEDATLTTPNERKKNEW
jgi:hypothetical protein